MSGFGNQIFKTYDSTIGSPYVPTTTGEQAATGVTNAVSSWGIPITSQSLDFNIPQTGVYQVATPGGGYTVNPNVAVPNLDGLTSLGKTIFNETTDITNNALGRTPTTPPPQTDGIDWGKSLGIGLQGLQALAGLWTAYNGTQSLKLAKSAYNTQKDLAYKNLGNSIKSYNTALTDRLRSRAAMETGNKNAYDDQIKENELKD